MSQPEEAIWLESVVQRQDGYESETVARFADRLLRLAQSRMPARLRRRVDPEDIIQSAFRSFFARNEDGQFEFQEFPDVWKLLAAITFKKVQQSLRFHERQQRDVNREALVDESGGAITATASSVAVMLDLLETILDRIPEQHREIIRLRMENYSVEEIAQEVGVSTRTVSRAIALVRKIAAELIEDNEP